MSSPSPARIACPFPECLVEAGFGSSEVVVVHGRQVVVDQGVGVVDFDAGAELGEVAFGRPEFLEGRSVEVLVGGRQQQGADAFARGGQGVGVGVPEPPPAGQGPEVALEVRKDEI